MSPYVFRVVPGKKVRFVWEGEKIEAIDRKSKPATPKYLTK